MNNNNAQKKPPYSKSSKPYNSNNRNERNGNRNTKDGNRNSRTTQGERTPREDTPGFRNFRETTPSTTNPSQKTPIKANQFLLKGNNTLCSFVILENTQISAVFATLEELSPSLQKIVISIHENEFEKTKSAILEQFANDDETMLFVKYSKFSLALHNAAFKMSKSDIFLIMHSGYTPRPYSLEILKTYLTKENTLATTPAVYTPKGEIQKYSLRHLTLLSQIKMLFSSDAKNHHIMMERGIAGYYKIHKITATLAPFAVNSKAFNEVSGFQATGDDQSSIFTFFKRIGKHGVVSFVPPARFVENTKPKENICFAAKLKYFLTNIA